MISFFFKRQLRKLDKTLFLKLNREKGRYVIYRRDRKNFPREILVIEGPSGEFCYPNYNHIVKLYQMDSWQNKRMIQEMDEHNESLDRESSERIHIISDEMSKLATRSINY